MPNIPFVTDVEVAQSRFPLPLWIQCGLALSLFILITLLPPLPLSSDPRSYLPLHITLEFLSIAAALMIFTVGWFSFSHGREARFQVLACAFLAVALLDFVHTLSYPEMPDLVTPSSVEKAINFWLPARVISALALLAAVALPPQTALSQWVRGWLLAATLIVISAVITMGLFFPGAAPRTFVSGQGLTLFKVAVEYAVMALYGVTLVLLIRDWRRERDRFRALLIAGIWILLLGELSLTLYSAVTDLHNLFGHLGKSWGDGFVFWAVFAQAMDEPHRRLQQSERLLARKEALAQVARQALEDAAHLYRAIFESRAVIKVLIDPDDGRMIDANQAAAEFYGVSRDILRQRYAWEMCVTSREDLLALFADLKAGRADLAVERQSRHRRADGKFCEVGIYLDMIHRENRCLLLATLLDLTARKAAEAALRDSEERYRSALVALAAGVAVYNLEGALITANPAAERILGLSAAECWEQPVDGENWRIIRSDGSSFPSDEWPSMITLRTGIPQREVLMGVLKPDDCLSWILVNSEPIRDTVTGTLQAVVVSFSDITAHKAAEDALHISEERLQRVLDGANDGFWDWNVVTGDVLFSRRWAEMLGYDLAEIEPHVRAWEKRVHPDDMPRCQAALQAHFAGETAHYQCEHRMQANNGEWRWILDRGKVTARDAQGQPLRMAGTHTDITGRKRMEEALRVSLAEVKRHDAQMVALNQMNDLLLSCETRGEAYLIIACKAGRLFTGFSGGLAIIGEDAAPGLRVVASWGVSALPTTFPLHDCWALRRGELHAITDPAQSAQCRHFSHPPTSAYLCIPLTVRGETFGLLHISADEAITEDQFRELRILALTVSESIKLALSNIKLQEALREQAIRDPLTGLFNRRYLDETLPRELHRCQRQGEPLAAAMLDVDHFKRFNDAYGHEAGDAVLRAMGDLLNHSLRGGDIACRYGGEELTVILPGSTLEDARMRLDRMRQAIMHMRVLYQGGDLPVVTVSIGVAAGEQEMDAAALLGRADAALYQAKADGRNRVIIG